jgi:hypothetical protein
VSGARALRVDHRLDLPLADLTVTLLVAEGDGQLIFRREGCDLGCGSFNLFLGAGTAAELRALAAAVEGVA